MGDDTFVKRIKDAVPLTPDVRPGTLVFWNTFTGQRHIGTLKEWDNGTAIVQMPDGTEKATRCDMRKEQAAIDAGI